MTGTGTIAARVRAHEWDEARQAMAERLAEMLDNTTSARDAKACALTLSKLIDQQEEAERVARREGDGTPLAQVLQMAGES